MLFKYEELTISKTRLQCRHMNHETCKTDLLIAQQRLVKHCWKIDCITCFLLVGRCLAWAHQGFGTISMVLKYIDWQEHPSQKSETLLPLPAPFSSQDPEHMLFLWSFLFTRSTMARYCIKNLFHCNEEELVLCFFPTTWFSMQHTPHPKTWNYLLSYS